MMTETEYLLICLAEECSEIQKSAMKIFRFGKEPNDIYDNLGELREEIVDAYAIVAMLNERGLLEKMPFENIKQVNEKIEKVEQYMNRARQEGMIQDEILDEVV